MLEPGIYSSIGNAIRSLYQMIMYVNAESMKCKVIDYNREIRNISSVIDDFEDFCEALYINIHPEDRTAFRSFTDPTYFPKELEVKVYTSSECRIRQADHTYAWSKITFCNATKEDSPEGYEYLFLIENISELKEAELRREAEERDVLKCLQDKYDVLFVENMTDSQTGCYNRKGMKYYSDLAIDEARETGKYIFVCVADLNGLKFLNDTYGHAAGDEAIAAVASKLHEAAPTGSKIVRTGGDEFLLLSAIDKDSTEPFEMETKIEEGLRQYNEEHPNPFTIGASYGWVLKPVQDGMVDLDEYVEEADAAMYEMKVKRDEHRRD